VNPWLKNCEHIVKTLSQNINVVCFIYLSLKVSIQTFSLSKSLSSLEKTTTTLSYSFMVVQQWHYWKKWALTRKKKQADGVWKVENSAQLLFTYIQADTHDIWTQLLILRRNEADAQKYLHSTLIAYQRVERTSEEVQASSCKLFVPFLLLPLSLPRRKKNSISTILLSFSLFCLFVTQTFLLPFPRSSASAFTGRAILAGITRTFLLCTCYEPTLARACIAHSVHGTNFGLD